MSNSSDQPKTDLYGKEIGKQTASPSQEAYSEDQWDAATPSSVSRYTTKYGIARGLASLIEVLGWLIVIGGLFVAFNLPAHQFSQVYAFLTFCGIALIGLFVIMTAQIVKATVDNADHTGEMLALMKSRK